MKKKKRGRKSSDYVGGRYLKLKVIGSGRTSGPRIRMGSILKKERERKKKRAFSSPTAGNAANLSTGNQAFGGYEGEEGYGGGGKGELASLSTVELALTSLYPPC